jgi:hypothetical protein
MLEHLDEHCCVHAPGARRKTVAVAYADPHAALVRQAGQRRLQLDGDGQVALGGEGTADRPAGGADVEHRCRRRREAKAFGQGRGHAVSCSSSR